MIKLKTMFQSEKLRKFSKKVFTKKKIWTAVIVIALLAGLRTGYILMYKVNGTITKVDTNSITVTNFLGTKTVNTGNYPIDSNKIIVGEKIEISKNLSGDVISIRTDNRMHDGNNGPRGQFGQGQNGPRQNGQGRQSGFLQNGQGQNNRQGQNVQTQNGQGSPNGTSGQQVPDGTSSATVGQ